MWIRYLRDSANRRRAYRYDTEQARWRLINLFEADSLVAEEKAHVHPDSTETAYTPKPPPVRKSRGPEGNQFTVCFKNPEGKTLNRTTRAATVKEAVNKIQLQQQETPNKLVEIIQIKEWKDK